ncbi:DUF2849 domain-containing protein [Qipengyuania sp.]|uniref:DUF2849 domain-containing protein n=1 Tax=Qipengyuania sp. TaxID=2004515 RepID=UPI0035C7F32D
MEKSSKLPPLPVVLTANDLRGGEVVYFDGRGWVTELSGAYLAQDETDARRLESMVAQFTGTVVDAYLVSASAGVDGKPAAAHYREAIRADGPTIRFGGAA